MGRDEVGEAAVRGVDFPGEDFAFGWIWGWAVKRDGAGWRRHEESVGELLLGERIRWWRRHEELVVERWLGAVWWCCGAGSVGEHAACGGEGCGGGGCELEGL